MNDNFCDEYRNSMEIFHNKLYLDNAAITPLNKKVILAMTNFHEYRLKNGSNFNEWWRKVEDTRVLLSKFIGCSEDDIAFLWNTSAGINLAAKGLPLDEGDEILIPDHEFPSNFYPWVNVANEKNLKLRVVKFNNDSLSYKDIISQVSPKTKVISVSWVSSYNGNVLDLYELGKFCKENNIYFVVDAIQGLGALELNIEDLNIDILTSAFFKWLMGPDGISFVYLSSKVRKEMENPWIGWASMKNKFEYENYLFDLSESASRYETGNMNFSAIYGVYESLSLLIDHKKEISDKVMYLTNILRSGLENINGISLLSPNDSLSGITLFSGVSIDDYPDNIIVNHKGDSIRVSPHFYNTEEEINNFLNETERLSNKND